MAGFSALNSKLRYLKSVSAEKAKGRQQSVVYIDADGSIDWPENPNSSGVLVVPRMLTVEQWEKKYCQ